MGLVTLKSFLSHSSSLLSTAACATLLHQFRRVAGHGPAKQKKSREWSS
ncbi:hypothetical protein HRUBRA_02456 [Pseudohaliea rubra DSM 19751]|uniref:Uncharacterized protein n=1 Tax=Pseudohaliea rubra DSM 19751 TaxID=1265313 RepID=A0A095VNF6_9GAMM|nr:hypothetical protein HRUBRA_02456 [Pseudohaliea rubra DSM 19751]